MKESMHFVEQKYKQKKQDRIENGKSQTQFYRDEPCASAHMRIAN